MAFFSFEPFIAGNARKSERCRTVNEIFGRNGQKRSVEMVAGGGTVARYTYRVVEISEAL